MGGKYLKNENNRQTGAPFFLLGCAFFLIEAFAWIFLSLQTPVSPEQAVPLVFGLLWSVILCCVLRLLPRQAARVGFGVTYFGALVYAGFQTGYYILFSEMMWLSDFRYAAEGSDYADVLLSYPLFWWLGLAMLIGLGIVILRFFPFWKRGWYRRVLPAVLAVAAAAGAYLLPRQAFSDDSSIQYAVSDYGRSQAAEAVYENMFNTYRLYQMCGLYQTLGKDLYANSIYPLTPSYASARAEATQEIDAYFASRQEPGPNAMTGLLEGKNVVLVLMESMDDWMIGEHTPVLSFLMNNGIRFDRFYTPVYGGIRTFNTEFCINTGSYLSSGGGYAFDYVTNTFDQSLAGQLSGLGYSAKTFHYNDPTFYSRGEFSPAMGYEEYVCYADYLTETDETVIKNLLYDDLLLFDNEQLCEEFFREGQPTLNFIITRSAHLSYKYNEVLSHWGLKRYPEFRGLTGSEETDCAYLKARLVDDIFGRLLEELAVRDQLDNTVIIAVTDHYTYGYNNMEELYDLSGVTEPLLLEKVPCFIWSADLEPLAVDKVLNTADLLPTVLNLMGVEPTYDYIGSDAFDEGYPGFVPFSDGSWIFGNAAYDAGQNRYFTCDGTRQTITAQLQADMAARVQEFIRINNQILESDYYQN